MDHGTTNFLLIDCDGDFDNEKVVYNLILDDSPFDFNLIRKHANPDSMLCKVGSL